MAVFHDNLQRTWVVRITPLTMRHVRDMTDVNLGTILRDEMKGLVELLEDPVELCSVLYAICQPQCEEEGLTLEDFLDGIVGECLGEAAEALVEGLQETFPQRETLPLLVASQLLKNNRDTTQQKVDELSRLMTGTSGESRWQAFLGWTRGLIRPVSST